MSASSISLSLILNITPTRSKLFQGYSGLCFCSIETYICSDIINGEHLALEMLANDLSVISVCTAECVCRWVHTHTRSYKTPTHCCHFQLFFPRFGSCHSTRVSDALVRFERLQSIVLQKNNQRIKSALQGNCVAVKS